MEFCAHRGYCRIAPENTVPAFVAAIENGYTRIETDPAYTKDGEIVLIHDSTLNRTCRNKDGSVIANPTYLSELTYSELCEFDAGIAFSEEFRQIKVPRLDELLVLASASKTILELDKKIPTDAIEPLVRLVASYDVCAEFSVCDVARAERILSIMPSARILYDGNTRDEDLREICALVPREQLTVYMYYDNPNFAWLTDRMKASRENCARVKRYARLGIANILNTDEMREAIEFGADIIQLFT